MTLQEQFEDWTGMPRAALLHWDAYPIRRGDEIAAIGLLNGYELHFAVAPTWRRRLITRRSLRAYLQPLLDAKGFLTTRVMLGDEAGRRFVERLGFELTLSGERFEHFMLSQLSCDKET